MRVSNTITLKKKKDDNRKRYSNNYISVISNSSKNDILKYNFINILIII